MAIAVWISAWLVFVFKLAIVAIASLALSAVLFALLCAAARTLRRRSAPDANTTERQDPAFARRDSKKE
ncbi:hypothetical protein [Hoeflea poritis]|uniref:Uncharacterized protein n=1 Tax=Hoeflea poritis TaxID=2993659 RepID=A0ABT4VUK7_9HYPH|nr:hypothetical protein [Hoeflea poritis]MDA4848402.1 hypothetical protein [Hoeflea poritis]